MRYVILAAARAALIVGALGVASVGLTSVAAAQPAPLAPLVINAPADGDTINGSLDFSGRATPGEGIAVCMGTSNGTLSEAGGVLVDAAGSFHGTVPASAFPATALGGQVAMLFLDAGHGPIPSTICSHAVSQVVARTVSLGSAAAPTTLTITAPTNGTIVDSNGLTFSGTGVPGHAIAACAPQPNGSDSTVGRQVVGGDGTFSGNIPASALTAELGEYAVIFVDAGPGPTPDTICGLGALAVQVRSVITAGTAGGTIGGGDIGGPGLPGATPELDSLLLLGSGAAGLFGYVGLRRRARAPHHRG